MPKPSKPVDYDFSDPESILRYAKKLINHTLRQMVPGIVDDRRGKGGFGQLVETGYFKIDSNSDPSPDFDEAGLELKTTPMKKLSKENYVSKERLSLNMINYMNLREKGFEGTFLEKDSRLLIIFYLYEKEKERLDYIFLKCKIIDFTDNDLRIIHEDWEKIASMVDQGHAEDISCGMTMYLEAAPKGQGHGKDLVEQPFSQVKAQKRAFALKSSFVTFLYNNWGVTRLDDTVGGWDKRRTFEDEIIGRYSRFYGMTAEEISAALGVEPGRGGKSRYAVLVRRMIGVKGKKIDEFEKAGLIVKTVRLRSDGVPDESMSFRQMDYIDVANQEWENSDLYEDLNKRFLFLVYRESDSGFVFSKAMFWNMPKEDLAEVQRVWEKARAKIREGDYAGLPKKKDSPIAHVRPHAKNKNDSAPTPQGGREYKRGFWLNNKYIAKVIASQTVISQ